MNRTHYSPSSGLIRGALGVLAAAVAFTFAVPNIARANTAGGASVVNNVIVSYQDGQGKGPDGTTSSTFTRNASVTITVSFVQEEPFVSLETANPQTANSSVPQPFVLKLYATANGADTYTAAAAASTTVDSNVVAVTRVITQYVGPQGGAAVPWNGSTAIPIKATVILSGATGGVVHVPGGVAHNIIAGDHVMLNGTEYIVAGGADAPTAGNAPSVTGGVYSAGTDGTLTLILVSDSAKHDMSGLATTGLVISQLYRITATATATTVSSTIDGDVYMKVTCYDSGMYESSVDNIRTTFKHTNLTISKSASPSSGVIPGTDVEYTVTVTVTGNPATDPHATNVVLTDKVPLYTTLQTYSDSYGGSPDPATAINTNSTLLFATISDGSATVQVNAGTTTADTGGAGIGFGNATDRTPTSTMTFNLGAASSELLGGDITPALTPGKIYTIKYKVKVN